MHSGIYEYLFNMYSRFNMYSKFQGDNSQPKLLDELSHDKFTAD